MDVFGIAMLDVRMHQIQEKIKLFGMISLRRTLLVIKNIPMEPGGARAPRQIRPPARKNKTHRDFLAGVLPASEKMILGRTAGDPRKTPPASGRRKNICMPSAQKNISLPCLYVSFDGFLKLPFDF